MTHEQVALGHLQTARDALIAARDQTPSRELSIAFTELESAILWLQHDMRLKAPPIDEAAFGSDDED